MSRAATDAAAASVEAISAAVPSTTRRVLSALVLLDTSATSRKRRPLSSEASVAFGRGCTG